MLRPHYVNSDQEFLILDGSLEIDAVQYGVGDYAYLPAGMQHDAMRSPVGRLGSEFLRGRTLGVLRTHPRRHVRSKSIDPRIATAGMPWSAADDLLARSLGRRVKEKILRRDPISGECTRLVQAAADRPGATLARSIVVHEAVEEMFVIEGEVSTSHGTMYRGAYAWRAAGTARGPFASKTGFVALIRTKGGHAGTRILDRRPVVWDSPLDPDVPPAMRDYARPPTNDPGANAPKY
jgi:hypothetical protein